MLPSPRVTSGGRGEEGGRALPRELRSERVLEDCDVHPGARERAEGRGGNGLALHLAFLCMWAIPAAQEVREPHKPRGDGFSQLCNVPAYACVRPIPRMAPCQQTERE